MPKATHEIFAKGHRMEPYYTAALALYKLEFLFRNGKIDPKYKLARFHIIFAARIIANGKAHPPMTANAMEKYCQPMMEQLWKNPDELLGQAVEAIDIAAAGNFDRDNIRTETFTQRVLSHLAATA